MPIRKAKFLVGIDEAGRGPIAGPVAVGVFAFMEPRARNFFRGVKESKQLNEKEREIWFEKIVKMKKLGLIRYSVVMSNNETIDKKGLTFAIKSALNKALAKLKLSPLDCEVLLDGGLKAPAEFKNQKTIIKGDEKKMVIALASICAKVMRDREMNRLSLEHPQYGFAKHKGYGTEAHYKALKNHGKLNIHRNSFLKDRNSKDLKASLV